MVVLSIALRSDPVLFQSRVPIGSVQIPPPPDDHVGKIADFQEASGALK